MNQVKGQDPRGVGAPGRGAKGSRGGGSDFDPSEELSTAMTLADPTAVTVTPDTVLHIADMGNLRIHSVFPPLPNPDRATGGFEVGVFVN